MAGPATSLPARVPAPVSKKDPANATVMVALNQRVADPVGVVYPAKCRFLLL